ncbi:MAG: acyl-CoA thioesterase [Novosphingobium sp.]
MVDWKSLEPYPVVHDEKVRWSDTDGNQHVNNVAFSFFYEAGRAMIVLETPNLLEPDCFFVIITTTIDFLGELHYPGTIQVANGIEKIGNSSMQLRQALFQNGRCASISYSTIAQVNTKTRSGHPLSASTRAYLESVKIRGTE